VVSKYVGDTEKALAVIFATGGNGAPALSLDEADALFGKRTEARDSHDRHADEPE
jgi:ATP-dependent 26S proteasome regulatory subunit